MSVMMKCGHAANAENGKGDPCCVICYGIVPGADEIDDSPPSLEGRMSKCCNKSIVPSSPSLAFFKHYPDREFDSHYCGCRGWD